MGSIIDPMADKALMTVLTVTLAMQNLIPSKFCFYVSLVTIAINHTNYLATNSVLSLYYPR